MTDIDASTKRAYQAEWVRAKRKRLKAEAGMTNAQRIARGRALAKAAGQTAEASTRPNVSKVRI